MYSGTCDDLTAINCHRDIWLGDVDPDINFRIVVNTEPGKTYYLMVEVQSTDDFEEYNPFGEFCLEVTRLGEECIVNIPDANFKAYLLENWEINTNFDDEIQCEEAEGFFGWMECAELDIADMTGIEAFTGVYSINCSGNKLTSLDVSNNTNLSQLNCSGNNISSLKLGENETLWSLNGAGNRLVNIDISEVPWLEEVDFSNNLLSSFSIGKNVKISTLAVNNNKLTGLNLANGKNTQLNTIQAQSNPNLTCIKVDDADYSNANWTGANFSFDPQHSFNESCNPCEEIGKEVDATFLLSSNGCVGDSIHFIDYTIIDFDPEQMQFKWNFGDGATSTNRDPVHAYLEEGERLVTLEVDIPGCESILINKTIRILNCLKNGDNNQGYTRVAPNPSSGTFRLETILPVVSDVSLNIYNAAGKTVYHKQYRSTDRLVENITFHQPGIYVAEIAHGIGVDKVKVVIVR